MRVFAPAALAAVLAGAARAQTWPPPLPELARPDRAAAAAPAAVRPLAPEVAAALLPRLAENGWGGLGPEAARLRDWSAGRTGLALAQRRGAWSLRDGAGDSVPVSAAAASALLRADAYFGMTPATVARPPTHEEIAAAALSPEGVEAIARVFERTIAQRLNAPGGAVVPEAGGEAALDGGLRLHEIPELTRRVLREVAADADDADALAALYAREPEAMRTIDDAGLLANFLRTRADRAARGVPRERQDALRRLTVDTVLRNTSDAYVFDPATQFEAIVTQDWSGRYVGRWHTHPPHAGASGWSGGAGPSGPDMDIAVESGQNLVISFQTEGFDLYDLAPLAGGKPDLGRVLEVSYRSAAWRARFQSLFDAAGLAR